MADHVAIPNGPALTRREALVFCRVARAYESDRYFGRTSAKMVYQQLRAKRQLRCSLAGVRVILENLAFRGLIWRSDGSGQTPRRYALNARDAKG